MIDVEHVPKSDIDNYTDTASRIEALCTQRIQVLSEQERRLSDHERLESLLRRLSDEIVIRLNDKVERGASGLNVDNASIRLSDIQVS